MATDLLPVLLKTYVLDDFHAVENLPTILSSLKESLDASPSLTKWLNRTTALIHSNDTGVRWAGLCLALRTSMLSRNAMVSAGQSWITVCLPLLSRDEKPIVWKATIKLLTYIFTSTMDLTEFQRQAVAPNVIKFSSAMITLVGKDIGTELLSLCLDVLSVLVLSHPLPHRTLLPVLSTTSLNFLNGLPTPTRTNVIRSASRLHASLFATGGKVGGASFWRKSLDETIAFCSSALVQLQSTFTTEHAAQYIKDQLTSAPLALDRLRCGIELLCSLLRSQVHRPVTVPIKSLMSLCDDMIKVETRRDPTSSKEISIQPLGVAMIPHIHKLGCHLLSCICKCVRHRLTPYMTRILSIITYHLEQPAPVVYHIPFVGLVTCLLDNCHPSPDPLLAGRILKAILPSLSPLLSQAASGEATSDQSESGNKKGKKRARQYEGDEVFKIGKDVLCENADDQRMILAVLDALPHLVHVLNLPSYLHSMSSRVLLALLVTLPKLPTQSISRDPNMKYEILHRVQSLCLEFATLHSSALMHSVPLILDTVSQRGVSGKSDYNQSFIDLMVHPRLPPLNRPLPSTNVALSTLGINLQGRETRDDVASNDRHVSMEIDVGGTTSMSTVGSRPVQRDTTYQSRFKAANVKEAAPTVHSAAVEVVSASLSTPSQSLSAIRLDQMQRLPNTMQGTQSTATLSGMQVREQTDIKESTALSNMSTGRPINPVSASEHVLTEIPDPALGLEDHAKQTKLSTNHGSLHSAIVILEEEDIEIPDLNMESDTDSDME